MDAKWSRLKTGKTNNICWNTGLYSIDVCVIILSVTYKCIEMVIIQLHALRLQTFSYSPSLAWTHWWSHSKIALIYALTAANRKSALDCNAREKPQSYWFYRTENRKTMYAPTWGAHGSKQTPKTWWWMNKLDKCKICTQSLRFGIGQRIRWVKCWEREKEKMESSEA